MNYSIVYINGHVEVYDSHHHFLFSADSKSEALEELGAA